MALCSVVSMVGIPLKNSTSQKLVHSSELKLISVIINCISSRSVISINNSANLTNVTSYTHLFTSGNSKTYAYALLRFKCMIVISRQMLIASSEFNFYISRTSRFNLGRTYSKDKTYVYFCQFWSKIFERQL